MKKNLPKVSPGKVKKNSGNNKQVFYSNKDKEEKNKTDENIYKYEKNIYQKINNILNSPNYIYKVNVNIKLKTGNNIEKKIIGRNKTHLITIENELIPINNIEDIKPINK